MKNHRLKSLIEEYGNSKMLADKVGVSIRTLGNWKLGKTQPHGRPLMMLAKMFRCTIEEITGRKEDHRNYVEVKSYVRILDLRSALPQSPQLVRMHCSYSFLIHAPIESLDFYAATSTGSSVEINHEASTPTLPYKISTGKCPDPAHKLGSRIEYDCTKLNEEALAISYNVSFKDAFVAPEDWWFHTHIDYPAERALLMLLFPNESACKDICVRKSKTASHNSELIPANIKPLLLANKTIALIEIAEASQGFYLQGGVEVVITE